MDREEKCSAPGCTISTRSTTVNSTSYVLRLLQGGVREESVRYVRAFILNYSFSDAVRMTHQQKTKQRPAIERVGVKGVLKYLFFTSGKRYVWINETS